MALAIWSKVEGKFYTNTHKKSFLRGLGILLTYINESHLWPIIGQVPFTIKAAIVFLYLMWKWRKIPSWRLSVFRTRRDQNSHYKSSQQQQRGGGCFWYFEELQSCWGTYHQERAWLLRVNVLDLNIQIQRREGEDTRNAEAGKLQRRMQTSCWFPPPAALAFKPHGVTRGDQKPWKAIKNPVSWPDSQDRHSGAQPPAETIRPVQAPRWRQPTHRLCRSGERRAQTLACFTFGGKIDFFTHLTSMMKEKKKKQLWAPPTRGRSDAAEQTNLSFHADLLLSRSPHVLSFKVKFVQAAGKWKQPSDCSNILGLSPRTVLIWWQNPKTFCHFSLKLSSGFFFLFFFFNSLKEQLVQIRSQLQEHDGKLSRITKQGSWCLMREEWR